MNNNFGRDYGVLYELKRLNKKPAFNIYYNNHLHIFCPWKEYLYIVDKELLMVIYYLYFRKKRIEII